MEEFKGTPGNWDIDTEGKTILSDAGFIIASIDLVHGVDADGEMMAASKAMYEAFQYGQTMNLADMLEWVADRLVYVHHENENVDFVISLRERASVVRAAIAKALGKE